MKPRSNGLRSGILNKQPDFQIPLSKITINGHIYVLYYMKFILTPGGQFLEVREFNTKGENTDTEYM